MVEQLTVNQLVVGSNPPPGAKEKISSLIASDFFFIGDVLRPMSKIHGRRAEPDFAKASSGFQPQGKDIAKSDESIRSFSAGCSEPFLENRHKDDFLV